MSAPPNPNRVTRRTLGEIRQAAQQCKDDILLGARVRQILYEHDTRRALMQAAIVKQEAEARARKGKPVTSNIVKQIESNS